ncbi:MAG: hypothetical protein LRY71_16855 [Bacillaceae bacterium]|nr:hypothetical protein [Bacillaceae bacterium]
MVFFVGQVFFIGFGLLYGWLLSYVFLIDITFSAIFAWYGLVLSLIQFVNVSMYMSKGKGKALDSFFLFFWGFVLLGWMFMTIVFPFTITNELHNMVNVTVVEEAAEEIDREFIPTVTRETAEYKGERVFGALPNPSHFEPGDYTIIPFRDGMYWVAPVEFSGMGSARRAGTSPGYVVVSATDANRDAELVDGFEMKYMPSNFFSKNLKRMVRREYPHHLIMDISFEPDEEGVPYYVVTVGSYLKHRTGRVVEGVVVFDPQTGDMEYFDADTAPDFVTQIYPDTIAFEYNSYFGKYKKGWINSWFQKEGVHIPTTYEGDKMTPAFDAEGNLLWTTDHTRSGQNANSMVGYSTMNTRTGEMIYYLGSNGVMTAASAIDVVERTFHRDNWKGVSPLLLEAYGEPTFVVPTIDKSNNSRGVSIVNPRSGQMVHDMNLRTAFDKYKNLLASISLEGGFVPSDFADLEKVEGVIRRVSSVNNGDRDVFYILLEGVEEVYSVSPSQYPMIVVSEIGDEVSLSFFQTGESVNAVQEFVNNTLGFVVDSIEIDGTEYEEIQ